MLFALILIPVFFASIMLSIATIAVAVYKKKYKALPLKLALYLWPFEILALFIVSDIILENFRATATKNTIQGYYTFDECAICDGEYIGARPSIKIKSNLTYEFLDSTYTILGTPKSGMVNMEGVNPGSIVFATEEQGHQVFIEREVGAIKLGFYCDNDPDQGYCATLINESISDADND